MAVRGSGSDQAPARCRHRCHPLPTAATHSVTAPELRQTPLALPPTCAGGTIALPAGRQAAVPARRTLHQLSASRGGLPSWVKMHQPQRPYSQKEYERNVAEVAAMKRARRRYDLVLWGDSMAS